MADETRIAGPVKVLPDAKERVAFELMMHVSRYEEADREAPRQYWLTLYRDCLDATKGSESPDSFEERPRRN